MTGKQIVKEISRIRRDIANFTRQVSDSTQKHLVAVAATDDDAYHVLLNQAPLVVKGSMTDQPPCLSAIPAPSETDRERAR